MSDIKNWRLDEEQWVAVYERDDRWQVRVLQQCHNGDKQWNVRLFFDEDLRHTIAMGVAEPAEAYDAMVSWIRYHHVIIA